MSEVTLELKSVTLRFAPFSTQNPNWKWTGQVGISAPLQNYNIHQTNPNLGSNPDVLNNHLFNNYRFYVDNMTYLGVLPGPNGSASQATYTADFKIVYTQNESAFDNYDELNNLRRIVVFIFSPNNGITLANPYVFYIPPIAGIVNPFTVEDEEATAEAGVYGFSQRDDFSGGVFPSGFNDSISNYALQTLTVDWGDGVTEDYPLQNETFQAGSPPQTANRGKITQTLSHTLLSNGGTIRYYVRDVLNRRSNWLTPPVTIIETGAQIGALVLADGRVVTSAQDGKNIVTRVLMPTETGLKQLETSTITNAKLPGLAARRDTTLARTYRPNNSAAIVMESSFDGGKSWQ